MSRLLTLFLLAAALGCRPTATAPGADVLLITVDTLRADHLGAWGDERVDTPALDRLAEGSLVFERAWASAPITVPSLASLLTSRLPRNHGVLNNGYDLVGSEPTLATALAGRGYRTAAFLPTFLADKQGFRESFQVYDHPRRGEAARRGSELVDLALEWIERVERAGPQPWFCWLHLIEPHAPYDPGAALERKYLPPGAGPVPSRLRRESRREDRQLDASEARIVRALYRGEVEATDIALRPLLSWLERRNGGRPVVAVFTADHGEMLAEHGGYVGHTARLYEPAIRVPLVLHFTTGRHAGERNPHPASLLDVTPTLLAAVGVTWTSPDGGVDLLTTPRSGDRIQVHETFWPEGWRDQQAVRSGSFKLLRRPRTPDGSAPQEDTPQLFDLDADSSEASDLSASDPGTATRLEGLYRDWQLHQADPRRRAPPQLDDEDRRALEALGYLQGPGGSDR